MRLKRFEIVCKFIPPTSVAVKMTPNQPHSTKPASTLDELLDVLDHEYCRRVLVALVDSEQRSDASLSPHSMWKEGTDLLEKGQSYSHLLKIDAAGFVDWDRETDTITRGPRFDELLPLLGWAPPLPSKTTPDTETDESVDELFDALSHPIRRHVLLSLADPDSLAVDKTMSYPPSEESDGDDADSDPDLLALELRHRHFTLLDDYGFVEWDPETETLTRGERFDDVVPLLDFVAEYRAEQSRQSE